MKALLNTTFFFTEAIAAELRAELARRWVPACASCGVAEPMCLALDPEPGIQRLAVQTLFASRGSAGRFLEEVAAPMADALLSRFGAEAFTSFSTVMELTEL